MVFSFFGEMYPDEAFLKRRVQVKRAILLVALSALAVVLCGCAGRDVQDTEPVPSPPRSVVRYLEVKSVIPDSQAEAKGVLAGDVIAKYDGVPIEPISDLRGAMETASQKPEITLIVKREGEEVEITLAPGWMGVFLDTKSIVTRLPDAKVIEGIPPLTWESGEASSWIGCARRVLAHYGEQHTYTYLMGISGSAFRLHFWGGW